jgi:uncharacterized linocin/CFP29 family protein
MPELNKGSAQIDVLSSANGGFSGGAVAMKLLQSGFKLNSLRTNDLLRKDEWKLYDQVVVEVARQRLTASMELMSRGLTMPLANALGVTQIEWETVSDMSPAELTMSGLPTADRDRVNFVLKSQPVPIVHKDFQINLRTLESSRRTGQSLDTTQAMVATKLVAERVESMIFLGAPTMQMGGGIVYGLTTHPDRNTGTVTANLDTTATGANYLADVIAAIAKLQADNQFGPYGLFVTYATYNRMMDDFKANSDKTILQRLLEIDQLEFIKPNINVPANTFQLVNLSRDTIEIVNGFQPTMVMWDSHGGFMLNFKIMAIMLPRVRSTQTAQSGIAHYS